MDIKRFRECAEAYLSLGWQIIPLCYPDQGQCTCGRGCKKPGKAPHYRICPQGSHQGTADMAEVSRWFDSGERFNLGIVTGQASGIVVVDVDTEKDGHEAWGKLTGGRRQETATVQTGSGGGHFIIVVRLSVRNRPVDWVKGSTSAAKAAMRSRRVSTPTAMNIAAHRPAFGWAPMLPWVTAPRSISRPSWPETNRFRKAAAMIPDPHRRQAPVGLSVDDIYLHLSGQSKRCRRRCRTRIFSGSLKSAVDTNPRPKKTTR